jgi:hypothetical protein
VDEDAGEMNVVPARSLLFAVWANNQCVDAVDAVEDVRRMREVDFSRSIGKWDRVAATAVADVRSEQEIEETLLAQLELPL